MKKKVTYFFLISSLLFLLDFFVSKETIEEKIIQIKSNKERYFNAGGNSHISYQLITDTNAFSISENFKKKIAINEKIKINKSLLFNQINKYESLQVKETYSLRYFSGLILPLFFILLFFVKIKTDYKIETLFLIIQIILCGNWLYLFYN